MSEEVKFTNELNKQSVDFSIFHENYNVEALKELLFKNPEIINQKDEKSGWTLLYNAVVNNEFENVEYLLKSGADPNIPNIYGETPLYQAVDIGNHSIINLLLEQGANPNLQQQDGDTPLHIAAAKGDTKIVRLLFAFKADPSLSTFEHNKTAYDYAKERNQVKAAEILKQKMELMGCFDSSNQNNNLNTSSKQSSEQINNQLLGNNIINLGPGVNTMEFSLRPQNYFQKPTNLMSNNSINNNNANNNITNNTGNNVKFESSVSNNLLSNINSGNPNPLQKLKPETTDEDSNPGNKTFCHNNLNLSTLGNDAKNLNNSYMIDDKKKDNNFLDQMSCFEEKLLKLKKEMEQHGSVTDKKGGSIKKQMADIPLGALYVTNYNKTEAPDTSHKKDLNTSNSNINNLNNSYMYRRYSGNNITNNVNQPSSTNVNSDNTNVSDEIVTGRKDKSKSPMISSTKDIHNYMNVQGQNINTGNPDISNNILSPIRPINSINNNNNQQKLYNQNDSMVNDYNYQQQQQQMQNNMMNNSYMMNNNNYYNDFNNDFESNNRVNHSFIDPGIDERAFGLNSNCYNQNNNNNFYMNNLNNNKQFPYNQQSPNNNNNINSNNQNNSMFINNSSRQNPYQNSKNNMNNNMINNSYYGQNYMNPMNNPNNNNYNNNNYNNVNYNNNNNVNYNQGNNNYNYNTNYNPVNSNVNKNTNYYMNNNQQQQQQQPLPQQKQINNNNIINTNTNTNVNSSMSSMTNFNNNSRLQNYHQHSNSRQMNKINNNVSSNSMLSQQLYTNTRVGGIREEDTIGAEMSRITVKNNNTLQESTLEFPLQNTTPYNKFSQDNISNYDDPISAQKSNTIIMTIKPNYQRNNSFTLKPKLKFSEPFYDDSQDLARFCSEKNDLELTRQPNNVKSTPQKEKEKENVIYKEEIEEEQTYNNNFFSQTSKSIREDLKKKNTEIQESVISQITYKAKATEVDEQKEKDDYSKHPNQKEIYEFLCGISLAKYTKDLISNGFDDLSLMIEQMSKNSKDPITDQNIADIGIKLPGHRARILVKLEELAKNFDFELPVGLYYNLSQEFAVSTEAMYDPHVKYIENWLAQLKMTNFLSNFLRAGYYCLELLLVQMASKNPINDSILEKDLKIDKVGYRVRILNKLKQGNFKTKSFLFLFLL